MHQTLKELMKKENSVAQKLDCLGITIERIASWELDTTSEERRATYNKAKNDIVEERDKALQEYIQVREELKDYLIDLLGMKGV